MARKRNYKAEYARRVARARREGYASYYHKRKVSSEARNFAGPQSQRFVSFAKDHPRVNDRRLYYQGMRALMRRDHVEADRIARQLGAKTSRTGDPPERIFWYHE